MPDASAPISRRDGLKILGALGAMGAVAGPLRWVRGADGAAPRAVGRKRAVRLAHLTDCHVQPQRNAPGGLAACLRHAQGLKDPPDLILNGGDAVMDVLAAAAPRAAEQADVWKRVWKDECALPVEHCIGNHDVWGWAKRQSETTGAEPNWGKKWAMDLLGLDTPYRSFNRAGWHFVVLDSIFPTPPGSPRTYTARLDDAQFDWLCADLAATPPGTPILVLSHIPILSVASFFDEDNERTGDWRIPGAWMHIDARRIKDLFHKHPNVKLCLSGHLHLVDRCEYLGVTYICGGAVCGNWWKGHYQETAEGYGLIDLYDDGAFEARYVNYGWDAGKA